MQARHVRHLESPEKSKLQFCFDIGKRPSCKVMARVHRLGFLSFALALLFSLGPCMQRSVGTSPLSRQIEFADAWKTSPHSRFCCLIYATQNGWKLPILFEEIGASYDWCLVDFEKGEQKSDAFLKINPNGHIPALIDREKGVAVAESGAILEYVCEVLNSNLEFEGEYASTLSCLLNK